MKLDAGQVEKNTPIDAITPEVTQIVKIPTFIDHGKTRRPSRCRNAWQGQILLSKPNVLGIKKHHHTPARL
ncbi:MAG: hypothetical protein JRH18_08760 [Deltaproteobacteria bacterium]|nr:hypothetical protein [Deltaproteobacteria bacterium]MBW1963280.1 hypothetical protein [Deltaproteobacteria bacterium]MBW1994014.1 hypothetical protein [Deltaproteobacteria bacterium]MBW2151743.1 hypothetical protein [Deltaproteobacteria bacterium]